MLKTVFGRLIGRRRTWAVSEIRDLVDAGQLDLAREHLQELHPDTLHRQHYVSCLSAEIDFMAGRDQEAERAFRDVLKLVPGFPAAHYGLSVVLLEQGKLDQALEHGQFAKVSDPSEARHWAQFGLCHLRLANYALAEPLLLHAVHVRSTDAYAWNNLGIVLMAKGALGEAKVCFQRSLKNRPGFRQAAINLESLENEVSRAGLKLVEHKPQPGASMDGEQEWAGQFAEIEAQRKAGQTDKALAGLEALCLERADDEDLHIRAAKEYVSCGDSQGGLDLLRAFLDRHPDSRPALVALGQAFLTANEHRDALVHFERALELEEPNPEVHAGLADAFFKLEQYDKAHEHFVALAEMEPSDATQFKLASSLVALCRYPEAIPIFERLLEHGELKRESILPNYSYALLYDGQVQKAEAHLGELLDAQPREPSLRTARFVARMLAGNFEQGWDDYAFRSMSFSRNFRVLPFPKWNGESLEGKRIVVLAEQGLGDQVMFASCLPDLIGQKPERVVVEVISRVAPTLIRSFPECEFISSNQKKDMSWAAELGDMDYVVPAGDLPLHFRRSLASFPGRPYLRADPVRVDHWRSRLLEAGPRPWVGISWRGGTQLTRTFARSMEMGEMLKIRNALAGTLVCLQYGSVQDELSRRDAAGVAYWKEAIDDLDEFSALICALDAVVSVCNTTIHYGGALGVPVWVLAPKVPEWRYGLTTAYLPWYSSVRVLRQPDHGDWREPLETAVREIAEHCQIGSTVPDDIVR